MLPEPQIVPCSCGACYERREVKLPIKDIGSFECHDCGARLEIWSGRKAVLFKRIETEQPASKRA